MRFQRTATVNSQGPDEHLPEAQTETQDFKLVKETTSGVLAPAPMGCGLTAANLSGCLVPTACIFTIEPSATPCPISAGSHIENYFELLVRTLMSALHPT